MKKIISASEAARLIKSNSTVMIGGFLKCGSPRRLIDEIIKCDVSGLTLIANDTGVEGHDRSLLVLNHRIRKAIVTHIGTNPETGRQWHAGEIDVELVPMGTLVERIRAGGAGLGGVLTPTGIGTVVANGKQVLEIGGKKYLFEPPLRADYALLYATKVDRFGNAFLSGTTRNFNPVMATAADTVIIESDEISDEALDPDCVTIPGVFTDYIVR